MRMTKITYEIETSEKENMAYQLAYQHLEELVDTMRAAECNEMVSTETGECVTLDELRRVLGILSGLPAMDEMYRV